MCGPPPGQHDSLPAPRPLSPRSGLLPGSRRYDWYKILDRSESHFKKNLIQLTDQIERITIMNQKKVKKYF